MRLADPEDVLRRMGVMVHTDNLASAEAALQAATPTIESILDTSLSQRSIQDFFDYRPSRYQGRFRELVLRSSQGYWTGPPKVYFSETTSSLPQDLTQLTPISPVWYVYDATQGTLTLILEPKQGLSTVCVAYTAGFTDAQDPVIPDWLREAAVTQALFHIHTTVVGYNSIDRRDRTGLIDHSVLAMLNPHRRTRIGTWASRTTDGA